MRKPFLLVLLLLSLSAFADKPESIDALKTRAAAARDKEQVDLLTKVAERQLQTADKAYNDGDVQQAQAAVNDVSEYGVKAAQVSAETGKKMKHTEIALRKISTRLEVIRKTLTLDDRPPVASAIEKLEQARSELLNRMFRK